MPPSRDPDEPFGTISTQWTLLDALAGPEADAAWRTFVGRYRPFVRNVLQRVLSRSDEIAAAETEFWGYVYLSDALRRADRGRRFRPYLSGIVQNFARAWLRRHETKHQDMAGSLAAAPTAGAAEAELAAWARNVLDLALAALADEAPSAAAALRGFYGLDAGDGACADASALAQQLGLSTANVYQLLSRGRRHLRALVEAELRVGCQDAADLVEEIAVFLRSMASAHPGLFVD